MTSLANISILRLARSSGSTPNCNIGTRMPSPVLSRTSSIRARTVLALPMTGEHEQRVRFLDAPALGSQVFLSLRELFERKAQAGPTLVVMEDWHWVDHSSIALCEHLLPLAQLPCVVFDLGQRTPDVGGFLCGHAPMLVEIERLVTHETRSHPRAERRLDRPTRWRSSPSPNSAPQRAP